MGTHFVQLLTHVARKTAKRMGADRQARQAIYRLAAQRVSVALQCAQATIIQRRTGAALPTYLRTDRRSAPSFTDLLAIG